MKFDSSGVRQWGTYYGGTALDRAYGVCTDIDNNVYITGNTGSLTNIATTGSHQGIHSGGAGTDAYLVKFNDAGTRLWGTYYGGTALDDAASITADLSRGYIYLFGRTASASGVATSGAWKELLDGASDGLLVKFDTAGTLNWATYFGGEATEIGYGVFCNKFSKLFIGGQTASFTNLATTGSYQTANAGANEGFFALFNDCELTHPDTITGSDTVCRGILYTYTTPIVPGAISYTWTLPNGWTGSSITNSIDITTGLTTDTIKVAAVFACGISDTIEKIVVVSPLPTITVTGNNAACFGDSILLASSEGLTYQWLKNNTVISNATDTFYKAYESGNYTVVVTNDWGCSDTSEVTEVTIHPLPTPVITANGMELSTGTYSSYQWYHNGTPITGAVNQAYTMVVTTGAYTVFVTDNNGCSSMSQPFTGGTGISQTNISDYVSVFPNPFNDWIYIDMKQSGLSIEVVSIDGRYILSHKKSGKIDVSNLADGVYIFKIMDSRSQTIAVSKYVKSSR